MTFDEAMQKGFLNISDEEATNILEELFDTEDAGARLDAGLALMGTFVPKECVVAVIDLANIILDANEELELYNADEDAAED
jgi:HEAT repeat protein